MPGIQEALDPVGLPPMLHNAHGFPKFAHAHWVQVSCSCEGVSRLRKQSSDDDVITRHCHDEVRISQKPVNGSMLQGAILDHPKLVR